jgi:hypothetical protein
LVADAQVLTAPIDSAARLGGSLGLGYEYQAPYLYFNAGARVAGSVARNGAPAPRIDLTPWLGLGVRFQPFRVGAEGIALLPLTGEKAGLAIGATVGVEF